MFQKLTRRSNLKSLKDDHHHFYAWEAVKNNFLQTLEKNLNELLETNMIRGILYILAVTDSFQLQNIENWGSSRRCN